MAPKESMYGELKRLQVFKDWISSQYPDKPVRLIEIGCGTGQGLLIPLAEQLPVGSNVMGVDFDTSSIKLGRELIAGKQIPLQFVEADASGLPADITNQTWDIVILSEVIEHVDNPAQLLHAANRLLDVGGELLITIPNGYGPFECERFVWDGLRLEVPFQALRRIFGRKRNETPSTMADTNRHMGFYTYENMQNLLSQNGFDIKNSINREWFCGPFSDLFHSVLKRIGLGGVLVWLTQTSAGCLPKWAVADWMIWARKTKQIDDATAWPQPQSGFAGWWWKTKRAQSRRGA